MTGGNVMKWIIKEQECGYLMKDGQFVKLLLPGKHTYFKQFGYDVIVVPMTGRVKTEGIPIDVLMQCKEFSDRVAKVKISDASIALLFENGALKMVLNASEHYFWNVYEEITFQILDRTNPYMDEALPRVYIDLLPAKYYKKIVVRDGELGLLYFDNRFEKRLDPGTWFFWNYGKEVTAKILNMKMQQLDISGQEILTADKVGVRVNMLCTYRITDPERMVLNMDSAGNMLYSAAQLIIREYIGRFRLDELLAQKEEIGRYIVEKLKEQQETFCMEVISGGIKDIILPGEIRDIMNTVLVAEKKAQANVIMRREEVASTRSLLNTAKLMDENQTLFKLKELEYLEKICDKVGTISLNGGKGVLEQLSELTGTSVRK